MSGYDERPWLALYDPELPADVEPEHLNALAMFRDAARRAPHRALVRYFDATLTLAEVDAQSDALAAALRARGFATGDRALLVLQNVPQFAIATLAVWKAGGIVVPANPMYRERELGNLLADSGAVVAVCLDELHPTVRAASASTAVERVITTSPREYQQRDDPRAFPDSRPNPGRASEDRVEDFAALVRAYRDSPPPRAEPAPHDVAMLTYTSGTTGPPKGAINTHRNVVFNARTYRDWMGLSEQDTILGVAPLFHITGLIGHLALALLLPAPLVLTYRFDPEVTAEAVREHGATFTIGAITVFIAWTNTPEVTSEHLASMTTVYSGGAPLPEAAVEAFRDKFGHYIRNGYGLTETNSPSHAVPLHREAPVDPGSGAVSVGVPVFNTYVRVVDETDADLPIGETGEIVTQGPQVVPGYWNKPDETAHALAHGRFHTGDVGFMDSEGWFYLVDRKKDQINAAGYKVWPREVEDVLYGHPAVREAAVVGVADQYRGETVHAHVSRKPGHDVSGEELVAFTRERLAAYKCPREITFRDELPKTLTGKILRRELREHG